MDGAVVREVGDEARRIQSVKKTQSLFVMRGEDRSHETSRRAFQRSRGRVHLITGDHAHLQKHLWKPILICSKTPSNIFVTPDISSCDAMVNGCWWETMFLAEYVNAIASMHY